MESEKISKAPSDGAESIEIKKEHVNEIKAETKKKNVFWDKLSVKLLSFFIKYVEKVEFESLSKISFLGSLFYYFMPLRKKLLAQNLKKCGFAADDAELKEMIKGIYTCQALNLAEFLWMSNTAKTDQIHKHFRIHGLNNLKDLIERKTGGIIISSHLGNWELLAMVLGKLGVKLTALIVERDIELHRFIDSHRAKTGNTLIDRNHAALKCMRLIKKSEVAGIVADQHTDNAGIPTKFFGHDCKSTSLPASLSLKTNCPIYGVFMIRSKDFKSHDIYIEPPLYAKDFMPDALLKEERNESAVKLCTQNINDMIEKYIKMAPEQWFWFHKRWRA